MHEDFLENLCNFLIDENVKGWTFMKILYSKNIFGDIFNNNSERIKLNVNFVIVRISQRTKMSGNKKKMT